MQKKSDDPDDIAELERRVLEAKKVLEVMVKLKEDRRSSSVSSSERRKRSKKRSKKRRDSSESD